MSDGLRDFLMLVSLHSLAITAEKLINSLYGLICDVYDSLFFKLVLDAVSVAPLLTLIALDPNVIVAGCLGNWWLGITTLPAIVVLTIHRVICQAHLQVAIHASIVHNFVFFITDDSSRHLVHTSCIVSAHITCQA